MVHRTWRPSFFWPKSQNPSSSLRYQETQPAVSFFGYLDFTFYAILVQIRISMSTDFLDPFRRG